MYIYRESKVFKKRYHIHISFSIVYCYNCSISLLGIVVNLLLCLICKLNFIIDMNVGKKIQYI